MTGIVVAVSGLVGAVTGIVFYKRTRAFPWLFACGIGGYLFGIGVGMMGK